jgi:hypothetical protein
MMSNQNDSRDPDLSIKDRLGSLLMAAERLTDVTSRITQEEVQLLGECNSRLRLIRGERSSVSYPTSGPKRAVAN